MASVSLGPSHQPTGRTKHQYGLPADYNPVDVPTPRSLRIVRLESEEGYYLLYCDAQGVDLTDTFHESVEDAMAQAELEFTVRPEDWHRP